MQTRLSFSTSFCNVEKGVSEQGLVHYRYIHFYGENLIKQIGLSGQKCCGIFFPHLFLLNNYRTIKHK